MGTWPRPCDGIRCTPIAETELARTLELLHREPYGQDRFVRASASRGGSTYFSAKLDAMLDMRVAAAETLAPLVEMDPAVASYEACPTRFTYALDGRKREFVPDIGLSGADGPGPYLHVVDDRSADMPLMRALVQRLGAQGVEVLCVPRTEREGMRVEIAKLVHHAGRFDAEPGMPETVLGILRRDTVRTVGDVARTLAGVSDGILDAASEQAVRGARMSFLKLVARGVVSMGAPRPPASGRPGSDRLPFVHPHLAGNRETLRQVDGAPAGLPGAHGHEWDVVAFAREHGCFPVTAMPTPGHGSTGPR